MLAGIPKHLRSYNRAPRRPGVGHHRYRTQRHGRTGDHRAERAITTPPKTSPLQNQYPTAKRRFRPQITMSTWNQKDPELRPSPPGPPKTGYSVHEFALSNIDRNRRPLPGVHRRSGTLQFCTNEATLRNLDSQSAAPLHRIGFVYSNTTREMGSFIQELCVGYSRAARRRKAFEITDTELNVIAALAITGLSRIPNTGYRTPAATGTPSAL